jgi:hypothetical protein
LINSAKTGCFGIIDEGSYMLQSTPGVTSVQSVIKTSNAAKRFAKQQKESFVRGFKMCIWALNIVISSFPLIYALVKGRVLYGDNLETSEKYMKFIEEFLRGGELLWIALALLMTAMLEAVMRSYTKKWKNITPGRVFLFALGVILFCWGIDIYMGNILNPITGSRLYICSLVAFAGLGIASAYINGAFSRRT